MATTTYTQYNLDDPNKPWIGADVDSDLDYTRDWTEWLDGDTISQLIPVFGGPLKQGTNASSTNGTSTKIWCAIDKTHATYKVGSKFPLTHRIVTAAGRKEDFTVWLKLEEH